jgi:adenylate cyclase
LEILHSEGIRNASIAEDIRRFGIGIHTGRAIIGNIGSPEHLDYSAIGSAVNLAARLCGQADATSIVVSKAVRDAAVHDPRLVFHSERRVVIRGVRDPVIAYTLSEP